MKKQLKIILSILLCLIVLLSIIISFHYINNKNNENWENDRNQLEAIFISYGYDVTIKNFHKSRSEDLPSADDIYVANLSDSDEIFLLHYKTSKKAKSKINDIDDSNHSILIQNSIVVYRGNDEVIKSIIDNFPKLYKNRSLDI